MGALAAGLAAVAWVTGCGGGDGGVDAAVSAVPTDPASTLVTEEPTASVEPAYPPGPEGELDRLADGKGWGPADPYTTASEFVRAVCIELPDVDGVQSRPQWLVEAGHLEGDGADILRTGVPKLCPEWAATVRAAASGDYERWFEDGTYVVAANGPTASPSPTGPPDPDDFVTGEDGEKPADEEAEETIPPGTYRAKGRMENCYWERTTKSGDIIDNGFATSAQEITVTIRASDGQFTSRDCAVWKPVK